MAKIKIGDHVSIPSHAKGTVWESGYVKDINRRGAIIAYGSKRHGIYGVMNRIPLDKLVKMEG